MIYLGIGSNLSSCFGNRFDNINLAISSLSVFKIQLVKKSSFYETPSYPNKKKPKYLNVVVEVKSSLSFYKLMRNLLIIEKKLKRIRTKKNNPRTCDIDIIDFNKKVLKIKYQGKNLITPHKKMQYRNFVLYPLVEISKNWKHPKNGEFINNLIKKLPKDQNKSVFKI